MQKQPDNFDKVMQDYARKWMKTLDRPRYSTSISIFFIAIFIFLWSTTLTTGMGYKPLEGFGFVISISIALGFIIASVFINMILMKIGISKPIRSGLWFSAFVGPYISIVTINNWDNPALSHIAGVSLSLFAFVISFLLDRAIIRRSESSDMDH